MHVCARASTGHLWPSPQSLLSRSWPTQCPRTLERCGRQTLVRARMSANGASKPRSSFAAAAAAVTATRFSNSGAKTPVPLAGDSMLSSSYFGDAGSPCPAADASAVPLAAVSGARGSLLTTHGSAACKPQLDSCCEPTSEDASTDGPVSEQEGIKADAAVAGVIGLQQQSSMAKAASLPLTTRPSLFFALPEEGLGAGTLVPVDISNPNLNQPLQPLSPSGDVQLPPVTHGSSDAGKRSQQHSPCERDQPQQQQQQHLPQRALVRAQTQVRSVYGTRSTVRQHSLDGTRADVMAVSNRLYAVDGPDMERLSEGDHEGMEDVSRRGRDVTTAAQQPSGEQGKCACGGQEAEAAAAQQASSCSCHRRTANGAEEGGGGASWAHRIAGEGSRRAGSRAGSRIGSPLMPSSLVAWAAAKVSGAGSRHKLHVLASGSPGCNDTQSNATAAPSDLGASGFAVSAAVRVPDCLGSPAESPFVAASGIAAAASAAAGDAAAEVGAFVPAAAEAAALHGEHEGADGTPKQSRGSSATNRDSPAVTQGAQQPPTATRRALSRHSSSLAPRHPEHAHNLFNAPSSEHRPSTSPTPVPAAFPAGERTRALSGHTPSLLTHLSASGALQHAPVPTATLEPTSGSTPDAYPPAPATAPAAPCSYTTTAASPTASRPHSSSALGVTASSCGQEPLSPDTPFILGTAGAIPPSTSPGCDAAASRLPSQPTHLPTRTAEQKHLLPQQHSLPHQLQQQNSVQQHQRHQQHVQHQLLDVADLEVVYRLTGETGSAMAMAPEICLKQPYNEKIDGGSSMRGQCLWLLLLCIATCSVAGHCGRNVSQGPLAVGPEGDAVGSALGLKLPLRRPTPAPLPCCRSVRVRHPDVRAVEPEHPGGVTHWHAPPGREWTRATSRTLAMLLLVQSAPCHPFVLCTLLRPFWYGLGGFLSPRGPCHMPKCDLPRMFDSPRP